MSAIREAWYRWKALRLPWRKRFLVGHDLHGNTFWEFRDVRGDAPGRFRRIAKYPRSTHHSDVKVSPQWHQWLRYMREHPPTLTEQSQELVRQDRMKMLAAQADARWEAKPRVADAPVRPQARPLAAPTAADQQQQQQAADMDVDTGRDGGATEGKHIGRDPWPRPKGGPSEEWQPAAWTPPPGKRR